MSSELQNITGCFWSLSGKGFSIIQPGLVTRDKEPRAPSLQQAVSLTGAVITESSTSIPTYFYVIARGEMAVHTRDMERSKYVFNCHSYDSGRCISSRTILPGSMLSQPPWHLLGSVLSLVNFSTRALNTPSKIACLLIGTHSDSFDPP